MVSDVCVRRWIDVDEGVVCSGVGKCERNIKHVESNDEASEEVEEE